MKCAVHPGQQQQNVPCDSVVIVVHGDSGGSSCVDRFNNVFSEKCGFIEDGEPVAGIQSPESLRIWLRNFFLGFSDGSAAGG